MHHDNDLADRQDGRVALAHDAELGPDQADGPSGVDAPFGLAGGECSYSSTPSSSLEPSGSASETTEDRTDEEESSACGWAGPAYLAERDFDPYQDYQDPHDIGRRTAEHIRELRIEEYEDIMAELRTPAGRVGVPEDIVRSAERFAELYDDDGVDAPFGLAGGECSYSSTPSSSLEPSGSAGETTEDRTIEYGSVEFEAAYEAEYYELRRAVESYILNRAGMDDSASGGDRDKALEAGDFYEINEFDGDLCAGWAKDPDSGMPTFLSFTSGGGWWCAAMVDGQMVVSERAARPVPRRTRASRAAARRERRAAAGMEEEEGLVRTARARSRGRGGVGWRETLVLAEELEGCA